MQAIGQGSYTKEQVLAALNSAQPSWTFPVAQLDYGLNFERWLTDESVISWGVNIDADSQPQTGNGSLVVSADELASVDLFNTYFQPHVALMMRTPANASDFAAFARWPQGIFRVTDAPIVIDEVGAESFGITFHDLSEWLLDEIENEYSVNEGDNVTSKIEDILAMSVLASRHNVVSLTQPLAKSRTWQAGTALAQIIFDLCSEIDYVAFTDTNGFFNCRPKTDPATAAQLIIYGDTSQQGILIPTRLHRDVFNVPNKLIEISAPLDDEAQTTWTATKQNTNPNSPISTTRLRALDGSPAIRRHVKTGVEAASQAILQTKTDNDLRELSAVPETLEYTGNFKPYHELFDVVGITRAAFGYTNVGFEIRRITVEARGTQSFQMRRNISLS